MGAHPSRARLCAPNGWKASADGRMQDHASALEEPERSCAGVRARNRCRSHRVGARSDPGGADEPEHREPELGSGGRHRGLGDLVDLRRGRGDEGGRLRTRLATKILRLARPRDPRAHVPGHARAAERAAPRAPHEPRADGAHHGGRSFGAAPRARAARRHGPAAHPFSGGLRGPLRDRASSPHRSQRGCRGRRSTSPTRRRTR